MNLRFIGSAAILAIVAAPDVYAQGVATDQLIDSITVTGERARVETPNAVATSTAADLRAQNLVNPEDALRYVPNLTIRKRYIGDRNALIGGRSFSTLQAPRGLVFMDGYLISNFLGQFDAPRWNMISPEEIDRVDVFHGPFSALYPGNSIGTTVVVTTRQPESFDAAVRTTAFSERFDEYGLSEDYEGFQASAWLGDRLENGLWYSATVNHQDAVGHPMQYYTVAADAAGAFPAVAADATPVTGVRFDRDPQGRRRAVFGASGGAIDSTVQNQLKLRSGYAFNDVLEIEGFVVGWENRTRNENRTFMRDATGAHVWWGRVSAAGATFDVPLAAMAPSTRDEQHLQWGATLRTTRPDGWNGSLVYSRYDIRKDATHQANTPDPLAAHGGPGTINERDGTGWRTLELQGVYTPMSQSGWLSAHTLAVGYHRNVYQLENPVYASDDWRSDRGALAQDVFGQTRLQAVYLQDVWRWNDRWSFTLGLRYEDWRAFEAGQHADALKIDYPERAETALSPKASLAFQPDADWMLRVSVGRGVRFPTVAELFQGTVTAASIIVNDPDLSAERSDAMELSFERWTDSGRWRLTLFEDDVHDSIFSQTNILVTPRITNVQNIERVRTRGVEADFDREIEAFSFSANVSYARSEILENRNNPTFVGAEWPRIPRWRANLQAAWRPDAAWLATLAARYSDDAYNRLQNDDHYPDTFGGASGFLMFDARLAWTHASGVELALGVDNLTDERAWQWHPYPARTAFVEARWSLENAR